MKIDISRQVGVAANPRQTHASLHLGDNIAYRVVHATQIPATNIVAMKKRKPS